MFTRLIAFLRGVATRRRAARESAEELQFHLAQEVERHIRDGASPIEARRRALRDLGGYAQTSEAVRDVRTLWIEGLAFDLREAFRRMRRDKGVTMTTLVTLTLAVGVNTAMLSIADAVLFRPLPYTDPDRVRILQMTDRTTGERYTMVPYAFLDAIDALDGVVSHIGLAESGPSVSADSVDGPTPVPTAAVSPGYFQTLGVQPVRGRLFDRTETGRVAVLSYGAWQSRFGGRDVIGTTAKFRNASFDIVGVLPPDFVFPTLMVGQPQIVVQAPARSAGAKGGTFHANVRLAPGVPLDRAQAAVDTVIAPLAAADPNWKGQTVVLDEPRAVLYGLVSAPIMRFLLVSSALILAIGCANLANMLLVRGERHRRDTALRIALGAGRARLVRPIIAEALLLGSLAAGAATLVTSLTFNALLRQVPAIAYGNAPVGVSVRVVLISLGLSVIGALVFSALPSWRTARTDIKPLLQAQPSTRGRAGAWLGRPLVALQVALSLVAVFGAVIAARSFVDVLRTPLGFTPEGIIQIGVSPPRPAAPPPRVVSVAPGRIELTDPPKPPDSTPFYARIIEAIQATPDVESAGAITALPLGGRAPTTAASLPGAPADQREGRVGLDYVLPGLFETLRMNVIRGRSLTWADVSSDPGALVISAGAAARAFGRAEPIGRTLVERGTNRVLHVVGVVSDPLLSLDRVADPRAYALPAGGARLTLVARLRRDNDEVIAHLKSAVRPLAPDTLVTAQRWTDTLSGITAYRNPRFQTVVLGSLATLALTLTAIGVFAVLNFLVVSRTREMGVRLALGAPPPAVIRVVLLRALVPVGAGLAAGFGLIFWVRPLAEAQLYRVQTHDPVTLALAGVAVVGSALAAAYLPARRAGSVDLVSVLRDE